MPELPEVEVTKLSILPYIIGKRIRAVKIHIYNLKLPIPYNLSDYLNNNLLITIERRGKYLLFKLSSGWLIIHLGMTGTLCILSKYDAKYSTIEKHNCVDWYFDKYLLRYRDPRRFGVILWHSNTSGNVLLHPLLNKLGVEPLTSSFSAQMFYQAIQGRKMTIKQVLLTGRIVVGIGNIYASEVLFNAGILPTTQAGKLTLISCTRLTVAIKTILTEAIKRGGSSLRDFTNGKNERGFFQLNHFVYNRTNLPCKICGTLIQKIIQYKRSTFYCSNCQK